MCLYLFEQTTSLLLYIVKIHVDEKTQRQYFNKALRKLQVFLFIFFDGQDYSHTSQQDLQSLTKPMLLMYVKSIFGLHPGSVIISETCLHIPSRSSLDPRSEIECQQLIYSTFSYLWWPDAVALSSCRLWCVNSHIRSSKCIAQLFYHLRYVDIIVWRQKCHSVIMRLNLHWFHTRKIGRKV